MRAKVRVSEKKGELALEMERECVCVCMYGLTFVWEWKSLSTWWVYLNEALKAKDRHKKIYICLKLYMSGDNDEKNCSFENINHLCCFSTQLFISNNIFQAKHNTVRARECEWDQLHGDINHVRLSREFWRLWSQPSGAGEAWDAGWCSLAVWMTTNSGVPLAFLCWVGKNNYTLCDCVSVSVSF